VVLTICMPAGDNPAYHSLGLSNRVQARERSDD
jgi:hypothetical protein